MKKKIFGFDLGIASIGWSVVEFDNEYYNVETGEIIDGQILGAGVRTFPVAENAKDGSSLAEPRRNCRLARKTCRRKARRLQGIKKLFIAQKLISNEKELQKLYASQEGGDVWNLRIKALSQELRTHELLRVLTHLAKHRGFMSYRKALDDNDAKDKENGKILKAIKENKSLLSESKTLAQIIVERAGEKGKKRNYTDTHGKKEAVYINSIPRTEIERELDLIYENQPRSIFPTKLYEDFKNIAFRFRPIAGIGHMVGYCTFEKDEKRAPKEAPSSELFVALTKINNMSLNDNGTIRFPTVEESNNIINLLQNTKTVKYSTLSKKIFNNAVEFRDIDYKKTTQKSKDGSIKTINPEDAIFYEMKGWHKLKSQFSDIEWDSLKLQTELLDKIMNVIACEKNDDDIRSKLLELNISADYISKLCNIKTDKFINLSFKALYKIIPYMINGLKYNEACKKVGYNFQNNGASLVSKKDIFLSPISEDKQTSVPVVNRTVAQFRKVYNAMVRKYGMPDQINIETGRELKKSFDERKKIEKKNNENQEYRRLASEELISKGITNNAKNILKFRLYNEQSGKCIYSGKSIDINRLDEDGYLDVDHIIPYSRSLDNSYNNKVLCLSSENRMKGNKTPFEYIKDANKWDEFEARVKLLHNKIKEDHLLDKSFVNRELEFRERNANDNSYISRYVKQYLEDGIDFSQSSRQDIKNRIQMRTGSLTDYLRHCWGLKKDRDESDIHHAQDAIVIACATQKMVSYLSSVSNFWENKWFLTQQKGEAWYKSLKHKFDEPWSGFRNDVSTALEKIFVSRPPRKNATGSAHKDTISPKTDNISRIEIRNGEAIKENMFRCDVYLIDKQYKIVPIYIADLVRKNFHHYFQPYEKIENDYLEGDEQNFIFSIYKDDCIRLTTQDGVYQGYFNQYNAQSGQIYLGSIDNSKIFKIRDKKESGGYHLDNEKKISIGTCIKIEKFQVGVLGDINQITQEKQRFFRKLDKTKG